VKSREGRVYGTAARVEDEQRPCVFLSSVLFLFPSVCLSLGISLLGREYRASKLCWQKLGESLSVRQLPMMMMMTVITLVIEDRDPEMVCMLTSITHHHHRRNALCREPTS
jgi:hypothetical protein